MFEVAHPMKLRDEHEEAALLAPQLERDGVLP